jgi:hypothetical protein
VGTIREPSASIHVSRKRAMFILAAAALLVGFVSWLFGALALPGRALIRGHVGDLGAAALVYALIALASKGRPALCALLTAITAVAIEVAQRGSGHRDELGQLVIGNHFDPWDLLAYAIGISIAVAWDTAPTRRHQAEMLDPSHAALPRSSSHRPRRRRAPH